MTEIKTGIHSNALQNNLKTTSAEQKATQETAGRKASQNELLSLIGKVKHFEHSSFASQKIHNIKEQVAQDQYPIKLDDVIEQVILENYINANEPS